jgi:hypothetical protein
MSRHVAHAPPTITSPGVKPEHNMIYAGTKTALVNTIDITKVGARPRCIGRSHLCTKLKTRPSAGI